MLKKIIFIIVALLSLLLGFFLIFLKSQSKEPLVGNLSRAQLEKAFSQWQNFNSSENPQHEASLALAQVPQGATIDIYLGSWCSDSVREVSRLWQALDALFEEPPFQIRYIGVDRNKWAPGLPPNLELIFVPTFVVSREGHEQGRIIESAPRGIEVELKELLTGEQHGIISGRTILEQTCAD